MSEDKPRRTIGKGPKFSIDPKVEYIPEHWTRVDPPLYFDPLKLGLLGMQAVLSNCPPALLEFTELVKIRFKWVEGYESWMSADFVLEERLGLGTITSDIRVPNEEEARPAAVADLGRQFSEEVRRNFDSRVQILANRTADLNRIANSLVAK